MYAPLPLQDGTPMIIFQHFSIRYWVISGYYATVSKNIKKQYLAKGPALESVEVSQIQSLSWMFEPFVGGKEVVREHVSSFPS